MPFLRDFFQNLFGGNSEHHDQGFNDHRRYSDRFRNPIWKNDEEDDDEYGDDYRRFDGGNRGFHFEIFTNPFEMTRYFESQMDNMLTDFFSFGFDQRPAIDSFNDSSIPQILPSPEQREKNLRDEVLKPGYELPPPNYGKSSPKIDQDLDGKLTADDFSRVWKDPNTSGSTHQLADPWRQSGFRSFGKSIMSQTIRRPDGTIEERRTVTDSEGNSETTVKRQVGDKTHTIVTKRDKDGVETKTENFSNIDESELKNFDRNWSPIDEPKIEPGTLTRFPWHKFFGYGPKL